MVKLKFKKLDKRAVIPSYAHVGDIGMDVTAIDLEYDNAHDVYIYHTGLACEMERGYALLCMARSSNTKTESYLPNGVGLVDPATYRGEIQFRYKNRDKLIPRDITEIALANAPYQVGDRIGQFVVVQVPEIEIEETDTLSETERGTGGFGSTGK
jgi:dUTP pyrophosphatase